MRDNTPAEMKQRFEDDGYLIIPDVLSEQVIAELCDEIVELCRRDVSGISARENFADLSVSEMLHKIVAIHFPHKLSEIYYKLMLHPIVAKTLTAVVGPNVKCMQSMLFVKHAGRPGQAWHQDQEFIPTVDGSLVGAWIALDDATIENGCLWVIPGSHKPETLWPMRPHNDARYDHTPECYNFPYTEEDAIPVEIEAGSLLVFDGYLLHRSLNNVKESGYRRSYVCHYMNADSALDWNGGIEENYRKDYRDIVMVAGQDPHAGKGIENLSVPYIRPEKPIA